MDGSRGLVDVPEAGLGFFPSNNAVHPYSVIDLLE